jgi:hypothetical protein
MVGVATVRMLADHTGLTQAISAILARPGFRPIHDRGRVLVDMACAIAAGGVDIVDIEALRAQAEVFGPVASDTTALRALWRRFRPNPHNAPPRTRSSPGCRIPGRRVPLLSPSTPGQPQTMDRR